MKAISAILTNRFTKLSTLIVSLNCTYFHHIGTAAFGEGHTRSNNNTVILFNQAIILKIFLHHFHAAISIKEFFKSYGFHTPYKVKLSANYFTFREGYNWHTRTEFRYSPGG